MTRPPSRPCAAALAFSMTLGTAHAGPPTAVPVAEAREAPPTAVPVAEAREAAPPAGASILVLPPRVGGTAGASLLQRLATELRIGLVRGRLTVVETSAEVPDPCDRACLARVRGETRADYMLRSAVDINDRDYTIRLALIDTASGDVIADSVTDCELCGLREFGAAVADQGALLRAKIEALATPPPALLVITEPPGALVFVDDALVGLSPVEKVTVAGKHRVRVRADGYVAEERDVDLVAGIREPLRLTLRRPPQTAKLRALGWAALFTGAPLAGTGLALLVLDGRPVERRCTGRDRDLEGDCRYVFTTMWGGAGLLAAGAVLGTLGALLLARTRDREPSTRRLRAALGPTGVSLHGAF